MGRHARMLDRNRPCGVVVGDELENPKRPRKFYQDGLHFDAQGICTDDEPGAENAEAAEAPQVIEGNDAKAARIAELSELSVPKLKEIAKEVAAAVEEEPQRWTGSGIKEVLVAFIADHTA